MVLKAKLRELYKLRIERNNFPSYLPRHSLTPNLNSSGEKLLPFEANNPIVG